MIGGVWRSAPRPLYERFLAAARREESDLDREMVLRNGSRIGVVGGGPSGSMFTYFLYEMAETAGLDLSVDVYEARRFEHPGPAGCNHCGGIVSESLVQLLAVEGVNLPERIVERGIEAYVLHMDVGSVRITAPGGEKRIAAVYRGNGPPRFDRATSEGFDLFLQDLTLKRGARVRHRLVGEIVYEDGRPTVVGPGGLRERYDLVAVSSGVNSLLVDRLVTPDPGYEPPGSMRTFICELQFGDPSTGQRLGDSMHVFLLDVPRLEFAALIPKGEYATVCLLGREIDEDLVEAFLTAPEVRGLFPGSVVPPLACRCFPRINVRASRRPYADRLVLIGDAATNRLYKDGIGGAYRSAKAAARTAAFHGVSSRAFQEHYLPTCRRIDRDNTLGRLAFGVSHQIQRKRFVRRALLRMTVSEQSDGGARPMSSVLWNLFTGTTPYREIVMRTLRPGFIATLGWNLLVANLPSRERRRRDGRAR